ncbi:MFS transporter [Eupransor demetentiae]|uniref:Sugar phosphate permease (UhpC) n=1 Tax=Eupransor demetentiae TaxID=3109584 RepID=A0ABP0ETN6_9LACO|nr:Sugar phosphate permease (UhpC) [Lactobacillaceae bacterium LMG 33000]
MQESSTRLKIGLFLNYFVHGCGLIILTQNLGHLAANWHSSLAIASFVLSGVGIGRLVAYFTMGLLSDKLGRKTTLLFGMLTYLIFFVLSPINQSIPFAYALSILAGIANSALDSATYPLLAESKGNKTANSVLIKAFMSSAEFVLPIIVLVSNQNQLWFGLSFLFPATILFLNIFNIAALPITKSKTVQEAASVAIKLSGWKKSLVTGSLLLYGYTSMAIMLWFTQWITIFAKGIGYSSSTAHLLLSLYSLGSISGVLVGFILLRLKATDSIVFLVQNIIATISIAVVALSTTEWLSIAACFAFGFSAAAGLMQIALSTLLKVHPEKKGIFTGIFFSFGSLASFSVPIITGYLIKNSQVNIIFGDVLIVLLGLAVAIILQAALPKAERV